MKLVAGSPGTWSGMGLRVSQCVFAAASVCAMGSAYGSSNFSAFYFMNKMLMSQFMWSLGLACVDIYCIRNEKDLHDLGILFPIVMMDWIMAVLVFSGASASASVAVFFRDMNFCRIYWRLACGQFTLSVVLTFIVWSLDAASALSGFWLMIALDW